MANKYNPFRPDKVVPPGMFCGRVPELRAIDRCLTQTKAGNPQHFLIEGERGIGKTSLLFVESLVASGNIDTFYKEIVHFITLHIALEAGDSYYSIIKKISGELQRQIRQRDILKDFALTAWDLISRLEAAGVKLKSAESEVDESELLSRLQEDFEKVISNLHLDDGILLIIDEADQPGSEGNLGRLCKLLTEYLTRAQCDRLCIGLAGLPGLITTLQQSHESSPRIFMTLDLKPLEHDECEQVISLGIKDAVENGIEVSITDEAKKLVSRYSEGYPHFLQEFSYYAYEVDSDNVIDQEDVMRSLFGENGTFEQLGRKYFSQFYNAPYSDNYRKVLDTMASHSDGFVDRKTIISESGLKGGIVDNALRALKNRNIILQHEQRRGEYRLPTQSFAVWIKAREVAEKNKADDTDEPSFLSEEDSN